ncbi:Transmembrane E3 ubiquitin-protein ligase 1 [Pseudozyma hubeiensis]|nr:Transmembrane E3 ubiquitin-protein ligase 1 [Pseudozyma hubeiensis]
MQALHITKASLWLVLLALATTAQASFISTLLFGKDTLEPVRAAIRQTEQFRSEVYGWYRHNTTQQANLTVSPDPSDLYKLLPSTYSGRSLVDPDGSYYAGIEGYYKGDWSGWDYSTQANRSLALDSRLNQSAAHELSKGKQGATPEYVDGVQEHKLIQDRGGFDWLTVKTGHVDLHLKEERLLEGNVSLIKGSLSFTAPEDSKSSVDEVDFYLEGLHFIPTGSIFLHAIAEEAPEDTDVRTTLSMIPTGNNETANATVAAMDKAFQLRIDMLQRIIDGGSYESDDSASATPAVKHNCSLHVYAQLQSAGPHTQLQPLIEALEHEAVHPTGISTIPPPPLRLSLLAYSPTCQLLLASPRPLTGLLQTTLWKKAVHYAVIYFLILFLQTYLLVQQMEATTTPSGLAKVSGATWLAQSLLDAFACLIHLSVAVALENETTKGLLACAFMSGVCFLAFGYRYAITIYRSQMDEVPATTQAGPTGPTQQQGQTGRVDASAAATPPPPPPTTTTDPAAAPATIATAEEIRARRRGMLIAAIGLFLFMVGFFPILTVLLMLPILYSFWIPQIHRNVQRGTRKAILKRTVIGLTATRLFVPLYILLCPDNVLFSEPSAWGWGLAAYVAVQAAVLIGQDVLGPHWFLKREWVPESAARAWEYHPAIEDGDVERTPEGYGDCAICLAAIESRAARRRSDSSTRGSGGGWWWSSVSKHGYDRISGDAEDYELDSDEDPETRSAHVSMPRYPPEKPRHHFASHTSSSDTTTRRLRRTVAQTIRTLLRWKSDLDATAALRRRRTDVMVAPCQHAFHTECLERWLEIKNECPSCRSALPPV